MLFLHCKEKFLGHGIKKATMHSKGGQPGHTCAHGWSSHIYSYLLGHLAMIVVSVLISVTTDMSPTGDLLVTSILAGEVSSRACSGAFMCCAGMALSQWQHTLWGNRKIYIYIRYLIVRSVGHGSLMQRECEQTQAKMHDQRQAALSSNIITAFTSQRTNLSPFTKACREWDASM